MSKLLRAALGRIWRKVVRTPSDMRFEAAPASATGDDRENQVVVAHLRRIYRRNQLPGEPRPRARAMYRRRPPRQDRRTDTPPPWVIDQMVIEMMKEAFDDLEPWEDMAFWPDVGSDADR
jgi:hypothetical protein